MEKEKAEAELKKARGEEEIAAATVKLRDIIGALVLIWTSLLSGRCIVYGGPS